MSDAELFNSEVALLGGAYRMDNASTEVERRAVSHFVWLAHHAQVIASEARCDFRPCFGLIANREINAIAFRNSRGTACVGLYMGAIQAIDGLFCKIFADRRTMNPIGRPEDEIYLPLLPTNYLDILTDPAVVQPYPKCPKRRLWADACTKQTLRFLLRHELAHVANGHLDFLAAQQGLELVSELAWDQGNADSIFDRQVLEFDADCCATSWWCGVFLDEFFHLKGLNDPKRLQKHR